MRDNKGGKDDRVHKYNLHRIWYRIIKEKEKIGRMAQNTRKA